MAITEFNWEGNHPKITAINLFTHSPLNHDCTIVWI